MWGEKATGEGVRNLIEVWREKKQRKRNFSRRQLVGNCMCQTRIDFILSKRDMECFLEHIYYKRNWFDWP